MLLETIWIHALMPNVIIYETSVQEIIITSSSQKYEDIIWKTIEILNQPTPSATWMRHVHENHRGDSLEISAVKCAEFFLSIRRGYSTAIERFRLDIQILFRKYLTTYAYMLEKLAFKIMEHRNSSSIYENEIFKEHL